MQNLVAAVKVQRVEEEIEYPRYLIGATHQGSQALSRAPADPLPLRELIFLNEDADIQVWLLANDGKHPLDLMVLESRPDDGEGGSPTPEPVDGTYPYFDREVWDRDGQHGYVLGARREEVGDDNEGDKDGRYRVASEGSGSDWCGVDDTDGESDSSSNEEGEEEEDEVERDVSFQGLRQHNDLN